MTVIHNTPAATLQIILAKAVAKERVKESVNRYYRAKRAHIAHPEAYKRVVEDSKRLDLPVPKLDRKLDRKQRFLHAHKVKVNRKGKITLPNLRFMEGENRGET